jgi:hypothetical protein
MSRQIVFAVAIDRKASAAQPSIEVALFDLGFVVDRE